MLIILRLYSLFFIRMVAVTLRRTRQWLKHFNTKKKRKKSLFFHLGFFPFDVLWSNVYAHWKNGCVLFRARPFWPYTVIERSVDWHGAAAAELLRHGGGYSVTVAQRRSSVSFPSSGVGEGRAKRCRGRENRLRPKRTARGTGEPAELLDGSKMGKCIAV